MFLVLFSFGMGAALSFKYVPSPPGYTQEEKGFIDNNPEKYFEKQYEEVLKKMRLIERNEEFLKEKLLEKEDQIVAEQKEIIDLERMLIYKEDSIQVLITRLANKEIALQELLVQEETLQDSISLIGSQLISINSKLHDISGKYMAQRLIFQGFLKIVIPSIAIIVICLLGLFLRKRLANDFV